MVWQIKNYKRKKKKIYKNELEKLKKQISLLEQDPKVKEYFSLVKQLEEKAKYDIPIIIDREHSNNILFE